MEVSAVVDSESSKRIRNKILLVPALGKSLVMPIAVDEAIRLPLPQRMDWQSLRCRPRVI
jgi:hypothetical protein